MSVDFELNTNKLGSALIMEQQVTMYGEELTRLNPSNSLQDYNVVS